MPTCFESMRDALQSRRSAIERAAKSRASRQALGGVREGFSRVERREVDEIDAALRRLERGSYGHCEGCGHAIGWQRLRATPEARDCRGCADAELQKTDR